MVKITHSGKHFNALVSSKNKQIALNNHLKSTSMFKEKKGPAQNNWQCIYS